MKLTRAEKSILQFLQMDADFPLSEIAAKSNQRIHSLRYAKERLAEKLSLQELIVFDPTVIGFTTTYLYFSIATEDLIQKQKIESMLKNHPNVSWLHALGGEYQYIASVLTKNPWELQKFLLDLSTDPNPKIVRKAFATIIHHEFYGRKYLTDGKLESSELTLISPKKAQHDIDSLDHEILKLLNNSPTISHRDIGRALGIAASTVDYRINQLKKSGLVVRKILSFKKLHANLLQYRILIETAGFNPNLVAKIRQFSKKHSQIISLAEAIGSWDLELRAEFEHPQGLSSLILELGSQFGSQLREIRPQQVIGIEKQAAYPF